MRIVLVDDEKAVRENLKILVRRFIPEAEIVGEANGVQSGLHCLKEHQPDLLLLDVEMKDGTGFDLLALYGELSFKVIFVTGHDRFAIKAFKYSAIDYLLKPVDPFELKQSLEKAHTLISTQEQQLKVENLVSNRSRSQNEQKIVLKDQEAIYLIGVKDVIRCESETNYTRFYLQDGRKLTISKTLKEFDKLFEGLSFFRSHQSHLINLKYFDRFEKRDGGTIHLKDGSAVPLAVRKREALMQMLDNLV